MLFFGEDSIVGLEAVFGEELIVALSLDICGTELLVLSGNIRSIERDEGFVV